MSLALERMGSGGGGYGTGRQPRDIRQAYGVVTLPDILAAFGVEKVAKDGTSAP